jgi:hypothetical protein
VAATTSDWRNYLRAACKTAKASGKTLYDWLDAQNSLLQSSAGKGLIQSTSNASQSITRFNPGAGGTMTPADLGELYDWALDMIPCVISTIEGELGRPPTPEEICARLIRSVGQPVTQIQNCYTHLRNPCGCC